MPVWESDSAGQVIREGKVVGLCYLPGDSLMPNPKLAEIVALRMESWEQANPGLYEEMMPGEAPIFERDPGSVQFFGTYVG